MREILFRGKRADNGEWVDGNLFVDDSKDKHEILVGYVNYRIGWKIIPQTVGQYTGLTDKNGTKIFEGDIVEGLDFTAEDGGYGVVTFDDGAFEVDGSCYNNIVGTFYENYYGKDFEVIGNIHDNPELLKGGEGNDK